MRKWQCLALMAATCLALSGCSPSADLENQAYALVLSVDAREDGVELAVRVPRTGEPAKSDSGASEESNYLLFAATGENYPEALDDLRRAVPRGLNLSHIKLVVVSESLAASKDFMPVLRAIAETRSLYTAAHFAVCPGSARAFIAQLEPVMGGRLSSEIDALFESRAAFGAIPKATLADAYYTANAIYSDPVAVWAKFAGDSPTLTGAALFAGGRLCGHLEGDEAVALGLVMGGLESIHMDWQGQSRTLALLKRPRPRVELADDGANLALTIFLSTADDLSADCQEALEARLESQIACVLSQCQRLGCDPFGFSEAAASHFATVNQWLHFNWRERYARARCRVRVRIGG